MELGVVESGLERMRFAAKRAIFECDWDQKEQRVGDRFMNAWFRRNRKHYEQFDGGYPCERCDAGGCRRAYRGEHEPYFWWPEDLKHIVIASGDVMDDFAEVYPRALMLCGRCGVAHFLWLNRRNFFYHAPYGRELVEEARVEGLFQDGTAPRLNGTPARVSDLEEHLALAYVGTMERSLPKLVLTRRSAQEYGLKLKKKIEWLDRRLRDWPHLGVRR